jgi:hypothetical protein
MLTQNAWAEGWPLLSEARCRLDSLIANRATAMAIADGPILTCHDHEPVETRLAVAAFQEIICCGEVPAKAVRSDCGRITPESVDALLRAASHATPYYAGGEIDAPLDEIDAYFDSCCDRAIFGPRSSLIDTETYRPIAGRELKITFSDVRVCWPLLIQALATVGFSLIGGALDGGVAGTASEPESADETTSEPKSPSDDAPPSACCWRPPGPKPGQKTAKRIMHDITREVLADAARLPEYRHGWKRDVAKIVFKEITRRGYTYNVESVGRYIRPILQEWENKRPDK